jgi:polyisoprenoid-binding protein YceI
MSTTDGLPSLESGSWKLDPSDSAVEFASRAVWGVVGVRGSFGEYTGSFDLAATPAIELVIQAASLDTQNTKRDEHLRSDDFFGVDSHPEVRFASSHVHLHGDHLHVTGTLSAGGRSITIEPVAHIKAVDDGYQIDSVVIVNHRELGMSAGPGGMVRPKSWLNVRGKLIPA